MFWLLNELPVSFKTIVCALEHQIVEKQNDKEKIRISSREKEEVMERR